MSFQATSTLQDGTYYNQARVHYQPWWSAWWEDVDTYTPHTAEVVVGTGSPKCGYQLEMIVSKEVDQQALPAGQEVELNYTVNIDNASAKTLWLCDINDWLPPGFGYMSGSSTGDIDRDPHALHWESNRSRYRAHWRHDEWPEHGGDYILSMEPGQSKSFGFKATATMESGLTYYNEIAANYDDDDYCSF